MKKYFSKKPFVVAAAVFLTGFAGTALYMQDPEKSPLSPAVKTAPESAAIVLENFNPGAELSYKIIPETGNTVTGLQTVGANGAARVPFPETDTKKNKYLTYDLSIQQEADKPPVSFLFNLNARTGEVSLLGQGLDNFAAVSYGRDGADAVTSTKADWAGVIKAKGMWDLNQTPRDNFKLAFFDNNLARDKPANPKIIKVFQAPGGGTPNPPAGVNGYFNLFCEPLKSGRLVPSTCDPPAMPPHNILWGPGGTHMQQVSYNIMNNYARALMMMAEQLSAVMMEHTFMIGPLLDAKRQLEVQRDLQALGAEAHKDYYPSETMCRFGSFIKSVPRAEERSAFNKQAMNKILMTSYTNLENTSASEGYALDIEARIRQFRQVYCDPRDNNNGLTYMCEHDQDQDMSTNTATAASPRGIGAASPSGVGAVTDTRKNKDIDYTRTADFPLTLDLDFTNGGAVTADEEDVIALARNLYWPRVLESGPWKGVSEKFPNYMDARHVFAVQNVAHNSYIQIMGMKAQADPGLGANSGWNFMKSMMREFGMTDPEIHQLLGDYPSYYAQMEVLTKKMYQNPDFYTNLYDKPVNVERIAATMDAIRIMQQRDQLESRHRQEMLNSMLVQEELNQHVQWINSAMTVAVKNMTP